MPYSLFWLVQLALSLHLPKRNKNLGWYYPIWREQVKPLHAMFFVEDKHLVVR